MVIRTILAASWGGGGGGVGGATLYMSISTEGSGTPTVRPKTGFPGSLAAIVYFQPFIISATKLLSYPLLLAGGTKRITSVLRSPLMELSP